MNIFSTPHHNLVYNVGDCIEFKKYDSSDTSDAFDYTLCNGVVVDNTTPDLLEVNNYNNDTRNFNTGICWVGYNSVVRHYSKEIISSLSTRLVLKEVWKDLIFREVKTVKTKEQLVITYEYVNDSGFVRTEQFQTLEEAFNQVPRDKHKNIHIHYDDYFGFTTCRAIRNNDIYCNQEVFFSRKCYGELNLNDQIINGNFSLRRGFNSIPPRKKQYICGLVEMGEKGLFYRKWFICSKEFLTLWTMICEPDHYSLKNKNDDGSYTTKSFDQILNELDTSGYNICGQVSLSLEEMRASYRSYNIETQALYIPSIYQMVARGVFKPSKSGRDPLYPTYEERFRLDLGWMKKSLVRNKMT